MSDIYDVLKQQQGNDFQQGEFNPEKYKEQKKEEKDQVYQMIEDEVNDIKKDEGSLKQYLDVQSKLERYSVTNTLLITKQFPEATRLREFRDWKDQGAYIKRNEKSIAILEPHDYVKEDGTPAVGYNVKKVFDISQTTMRPPRGRGNLDERTILKALIEASPYTVRAAEEGAEQKENAVVDPEQKCIVVKRGLETPDFFKAVAEKVMDMELAYTSKEDNPKLQEFQVKCGTYMLCEKYGIDTKDIQVGKLPKEYTKMEPMDVRGKLTEIKEAMSQVNNQMSLSLNRQKEARKQEQER